MRGYTILPKNKFYILITAVSIIIFMLSIEVTFRVKDLTLFEEWYTNILVENISKEEAYGIYLTSHIGLYFFKIIVPATFGLQTYFAYTKLRINIIYVFVWTVLLLGSFIFILLGFELTSIFYYILVISYVVLIVTVSSLYKEVNRKVKG